MRRLVLTAVSIAAGVALAAPATASTSAVRPQIRDAAGDWVVPSQDILDVTINATTKTLTADLHLAAPPATGVRADYDVILTVGCTWYALHFGWNGAPQTSKASLDTYPCSSGDTVTDEKNSVQPVASVPATATLTATGLRITSPVTRALHRGVRVQSAAATRLAEVVVEVGGLDSSDPTIGGDLAYGRTFALGT